MAASVAVDNLVEGTFFNFQNSENIYMVTGVGKNEIGCHLMCRHSDDAKTDLFFAKDKGAVLLLSDFYSHQGHDRWVDPEVYKAQGVRINRIASFGIRFVGFAIFAFMTAFLLFGMTHSTLNATFPETLLICSPLILGLGVATIGPAFYFNKAKKALLLAVIGFALFLGWGVIIILMF